MTLRLRVAAVIALALTTCAAPSEPGVERTERAPATGGGAAQSAAARTVERLDAVLEDPRRDGDRARDAYRHPRETIAFFGLTPEMTIAEVLPGGGWYTRILAPYVGEDGALIGLDYSLLTRERMAGESWSDEQRAFHLSFEEDFPEAARAAAPDGVNVVGGYLFGAIPPELYGTADAVLFIRALHNMRATSTMNEAIADAYALLKPGGVVGVVQHRANATASAEYANGSHQYLHEADVIAAFEAAGFVLEATSEVNANPRDRANWPNGARTLPPTLTLGLLNRDDYIAIGESDRMTLRFRKPSGG